MISLRTYLDFNATAPLRPEARAAVITALDEFGNPSSVHSEGRRARAIVAEARAHVAGLVGAKTGEVIFTASGTEGAAAVMAMDWDTIIVCRTEHSAVLTPARGKANGRTRVVEVGVTEDGTVDVEDCSRAMADAAGSRGRTLLALQMANNETGVIHPVGQVFSEARELGIATFCDAVQTAGRLKVDVGELSADFMVLSGHKLGAPKGTGALIVRDGAGFAPLITGGGQEKNRRAGTENVVGIAGFGAAARAALDDFAVFAQLAELRDALEGEVRRLTPEAIIAGAGADRLANTSLIASPGKRGETLVIGFDLAGIAVSSGAACSSGKVGRSHVLEAMGLEPDAAQSAIRVSLGWSSSRADVDRFLTVWADTARRDTAAQRVA